MQDIWNIDSDLSMIKIPMMTEVIILGKTSV